MVGEEGGGEEVAKKRRSEPPTTHLTKRMESTKRSQPMTAEFPWSAVPEHWIAMRANAEPILEANFRSRVNPCVLEVNASKGREFESSHLPDHVGDGLDDLEVLGAGHAVPTATELNAGDMFHEYVLASDVI